MSRVEVSIVMACRNGAQYIEAAVQSVLNQTFQSWELLVVDNCSSDGSADIVGEYTRLDSRVILLEEENLGASYARNLAISRAKGRYIAFLDCDDLWDPDKLCDQITFMRKNNVAMSWTSYRKVDCESNYIGSMPCQVQISVDSLLKKKSSIGCLTVVYDTACFGKVEMPNIKMRQDYGLFLKLLSIAEKNSLYCSGIESSLASYRVHSESMTHNKLAAAMYQWRFYRTICKFNFVRSSLLIFHYVFYSLISVIR